MSKILVIGDLHFRESMSYAEYIADRRVSEKKEVLDFIVSSAHDCEHVVMVGDISDVRNPSSNVTRDIVEFIERFRDKQVWILAGNHDRKGDGTTAIDFLAEIDKPNWHVITRGIRIGEKLGNITADFLPYVTKNQLGVATDTEGTAKIMSLIDEMKPHSDIIFMHHAISDMMSNGVSTNVFNEIVMPKTLLESHYKMSVAGHIHRPSFKDKTLMTGCVFNNEVGEDGKFIWKIDEKFKVEKVRLPGRSIYFFENPNVEEFLNYPESSIVKVSLTDRSANVDSIKEGLKRFHASLLIEQYPNERQKTHVVEGGALDLGIENLLKVYAKSKDIDEALLMKGYSLLL